MIFKKKKIDDDFDDIDETPVKGYMNNPRLKKVGEQIKWTPKMLEELDRCSKDIIYFAETYFKIVNIDRGLITIPLYEYQKQMLLHYQESRYSLCLCARQIGKTIVSTIFVLHHVLFNDYKTVAILANKGMTAREILSRVQLAYENLPKWLQQGIITWNKGSFELENGSKVLCAATSSSAIRGFSISTLILDEAAFIGNFEEFYRSVYHTISSGQKSKMMMISTANGFNHFYKFVDDARKKKSSFKLFEVTWRDVPGRDEKWKQETIANTSEEAFLQEQENIFLGSSGTLINHNKIASLTYETPVIIKNDIYIYKEISNDPEAQYVITVDVSEGIGGDYHSISVFRVDELPYEQVATYRNNRVSPTIELPQIINNLSKYYNDASILIETNLSLGNETAKILYEELENEFVLMTSANGKAGQVISGGFGNVAKYGVKMTKAVKRIGCSRLKDLIEGDKLIIKDFNTIAEISTFIKKKDSYQADDGNHDDMVMGLVIFAWMTSQQYFQDSNDASSRKKLYEEQLRRIEEDLLPVGIMSDSYIDTNEFKTYWD
jgi:hypothetical protein